MSPVSSGRKTKKKTRGTRKRMQPYVLPSPPEACDCPYCAGEALDPDQLVGDLVASGGDLLECEDPLDAEIIGATFVSIGQLAGEGFEQALAEGMIPGFEANATAEALALLVAIGSVSEGDAGVAARRAADRLAAAGVPRPTWADELFEPMTVSDCRRLADDQGLASLLTCVFHRAGRDHAIAMSVDHVDCGAASEIHLLDVDGWPAAREAMRNSGRESGVDVVEEELDPAGLRWHVENALDARAVHDQDLGVAGSADPLDLDGPSYQALATLLRARIGALPTSDKPKPPHGNGHTQPEGIAAALQMLAKLRGPEDNPFAAAAPKAKLPAKRKKSTAPAPVYQIKIGLRGAKPPIWRRLEVPADIRLDRLHAVIQIAFGWDDTHLHVFETQYGEFGVANPDLGHRAESPVTLEQVAPDVRSTIRYTYDFGDDWQHDIRVEKILDRAERTSYPRCTGGRRAAPPEDCGGVWGYEGLIEVAADPSHPEHEETLDWLGLDDTGDFDPASFDAAAVTKSLARLR